MKNEKTTVTMDQKILRRRDNPVKGKVFPNRSRVIQNAVSAKRQRLERNRFARECAKLDKKTEQAMAEEGFGS